jgi:hypothetical protein
MYRISYTETVNCTKRLVVHAPTQTVLKQALKDTADKKNRIISKVGSR